MRVLTYRERIVNTGAGMDVGEDARLLAMLKQARRDSGLPLDFWADLIEGLPHNFAAILCGRSAMFPKYMNSKVRP